MVSLADASWPIVVLSLLKKSTRQKKKRNILFSYCTFYFSLEIEKCCFLQEETILERGAEGTMQRYLVNFPFLKKNIFSCVDVHLKRVKMYCFLCTQVKYLVQIQYFVGVRVSY